MWARWLLLGALGALLAGVEGSFLPLVARRLLGHFQHLLGGSRAVLGKEERRFEAPIDFRKLPPNYHTEEKEQRRVGNATLYSHREINKVTDNETGAMLFSDRTVTSVEQGERGLAERWRGSQAESSKEGAGDGAEADPVLGRHVLPIPRPGLAFLIIHLRRRARPGKASDISWPDGASLSDRRHRLLAIRDGLMEAPRPLKKAPPITQAWHKAVARGPIFFFFFRKL
ncbi:LOW QUALITY PROTEIN: dickkopf-like protein 1 [Trachemys scripta elegans]|uniref:LOW QUALITY PROTEIN: dickkopf-like protein 1 n=1 Tax=Trachemys scripta elegans TaxID=31138 RepID=UPI001557EF2B|nr:LOW QUALITY PROTEIN: dickkopf-like protein 1 [Trachemys scripta elegans]